MSDTPDKDNVVFLAYSNDKLQDAPTHVTFMQCKHCKNKTFTLILTPVIEDDDKYPLCRCAACGVSVGRIGWVKEGE